MRDKRQKSFGWLVKVSTKMSENALVFRHFASGVPDRPNWIFARAKTVFLIDRKHFAASRGEVFLMGRIRFLRVCGAHHA